MRTSLSKYLCAAIVAGGLFCLPNTGTAGAVEDQIQAISSSFAEAGSASFVKTSIEAAVLVPRLYEQRDFQPAWFGRATTEELFRELNRGVEQGFLPGDFHLPLLFDMHEAAKTGGPDEIAAFDVVASDAAVTLIHHMVFGKVDPGALDGDWNFSKPVIKQDPAVVLNNYLNGEGFSALMARIDLDAPQYLQLLTALERYRGIALAGGWPQVPEGTVLKPGMSDPAVAILRQRLANEGVLNEGQILPVAAEGGDPASIYDERLQADVQVFQERHGLEADGVIGGRTFASLNRTASDRVNQLRLSLERGRWLMRDLEDEYVLVNIAGARTYLVKGDGTLWTTRSITGSQYRKTPVFRDEIKYMEFNPTWTVPNSIFRKDKLARIRKDPGYLTRNNYIVRTRDGSTVPASSVNWSANNPAVTLVQQPGPNNALGLVKFMFPNEHAVYLHDTNAKDLFGRNERNLSSGCVRLEHPFEFASLLMEGDPDWSYARMQAILDSKKTTRVNLPAPMPVLITYWTAWVENGVVQFREDPYGRDGPILEALDR